MIFTHLFHLLAQDVSPELGGLILRSVGAGFGGAILMGVVFAIWANNKGWYVTGREHRESIASVREVLSGVHEQLENERKLNTILHVGRDTAIATKDRVLEAMYGFMAVLQIRDPEFGEKLKNLMDREDKGGVKDAGQ